jgi:riboflavin kinase/FMN adenylyltransferase
MLIIKDRTDPITRDSVCGIGSFDGVHRGHQAIVHYLKESAGAKKKTGIITFTPLPFFILRKAPICCLTPDREKEEIFTELGVDFMFYFEFSEDFARLSPEDFVASIAGKLAPSMVVVGENFHFGTGRKGTAQLLRTLSGESFAVEIMSRITDEGTISSTRIRELILLGSVKAAGRLLGRPYSVAGIVTKGRGRGMKLGFPTINIVPPPDKLIPLDGVYKASVITDHGEHLGALFCRHDLLEVHIIGFSGDLYGEKVTVKFAERIRGIEHFASEQALTAAIAEDIKKIVVE